MTSNIDINCEKKDWNRNRTSRKAGWPLQLIHNVITQMELFQLVYSIAKLKVNYIYIYLGYITLD